MHSSTKDTINKDNPVQNAINIDIPVQKMQSVRTFQYKTCSQSGYSSTKNAASKDIPVQNMQSIRIFQ
jgi:hypothetical protein